jgi:hypothetical protein
MHFGMLVERFSEGEGSEDDEDEDDLPPLVRSRTSMVNVIASEEDENEYAKASVGVCEQ